MPPKGYPSQDLCIILSDGYRIDLEGVAGKGGPGDGWSSVEWSGVDRNGGKEGLRSEIAWGS